MPRRSKDLIFAEVDDKALLAALKKLPKEVQAQVRQENQQLANELKQELISKAVVSLYGETPPQAALVAKAVYAKRDRLIRVDVGGPKMVGTKYGSRDGGRKNAAAAGQLLYGSEFGSSGKPKDRTGRKMGSRFQARHKESGYWITPTYTAFAGEALVKWRETIARYLDRIGAS